LEKNRENREKKKKKKDKMKKRKVSWAGTCKRSLDPRLTDIDRSFIYHREERMSVTIVMLKMKKDLKRKKALPMVKMEPKLKINQPRRQRLRNQLKNPRRLRAFGLETCHSQQPKQI
jgi:hypothetical protein